MIPCINCITISMCKAQIGTEIPYTKIITRLLPKCSLLQKFAAPHVESYMEFSPWKIEEIRDYLIYGVIK